MRRCAREPVRTGTARRTIRRAAEGADLAVLAAGVTVMSIIVVVFNRLVWRRCYALAERRFSLGS